MDVEDAVILKSVFREMFPESCRENPDFTAYLRENPDFSAYLAELRSSGVDALRREPERLQEERALILQQTRDLAFSNYQTFIRTATCTENTYRDFGRVEGAVSRLLDKLPGFGEKCRVFMKEAEEIGSSRRMNSLTLNRHTEILEILEIPQLMDTCVRNGYYEEALELAAYVKRLEKKHSALPVIQSIVCEVRQSAGLMLNQLLQQLRSNAPLPACLRVIGYLRRMDAFTEAELRVKFLQARGTWLKSVLNAIPEDDAYFHITKTMEACRVHLFDIITQYRAIFSDDEAPPPGHAAVHEAAIFHGWVVTQVADFLSALRRDLERGVGGRLDSLLGQCMYFGLSFSRVGADFRGQLAPVFQRAAAETFGAAVRDAVDGFREDMNRYTLITLPSALGGAGPRAAPEQPGTLTPPMALLDFPPLAALLNRVLAAFNDLRLCCPLGLASHATSCLQDAMATVTRHILVFHRAEESAFSPPERELFLRFCCCYADDMLPFINRCLGGLFPPAQLGLVLGLPPTQLSRFRGLGWIDVDSVLQPLDFILPQRETPVPVPDLDQSSDLVHLSPEDQLPGPEPEPEPSPEPGSPQPGLRESEEPEETDQDFTLD